MNEPLPDPLEAFVMETAAAFAYPPTPDVAGGARRRLALRQPRFRVERRLAAAAALLLLAFLLVVTAVPPVRAALLRALRIGAVQINLLQETQPGPTELPAPQPVSITGLGETISLEEAAALISLHDPLYPPALGEADAIYGQNLLFREPVITFLWRATADRPQITLTQIEIPDFAVKWAAGEQVTETDVGGRTAVWIEGPHVIDLQDFNVDHDVVLATNVLIWSADNVTYRLEGEITLQEALAIAASWAR